MPPNNSNSWSTQFIYTTTGTNNIFVGSQAGTAYQGNMYYQPVTLSYQSGFYYQPVIKKRKLVLRLP